MSDFNLGRHEQAIETLVIGMAALQTDVSDIKQTLAERKGERRVATWLLCTASSALGAAFVMFVPRFLK